MRSIINLNTTYHLLNHRGDNYTPGTTITFSHPLHKTDRVKTPVTPLIKAGGGRSEHVCGGSCPHFHTGKCATARGDGHKSGLQRTVGLK
ncbi:hypothetical protein JTE90_017906 [Oedothorax gibbosus]|uniref:Uncharacterized protein n=1 Tax=Oedothorax gibbosus TaxID=931172 RepID=A0AAV6VIA8_9ARAC|nr:hypothetical protein JTE90_017906 [Oedothorax gibbosus]